jgi:hypothetical protein
MNLDSLKAKLRGTLDVDKNDKVNLQDVAAYINSSAKTKLYVYCAAGLIIGVLIGKFAL